MTEEYLYTGIIKLDTPVGYFCITLDDEKIPFSVKRNGFNLPYEVTDEGNSVIGKIQTDTNYCIVIDTKRLQIGKEYTVHFCSEYDNKWERCDSDEHTTCFNTVINNWVVGIGAYDPNDQEKEDQSWRYSEKMGYLKQNYVMEPPTYDEANFRAYSVDVLDSFDGYKFKLFDYSSDKVFFEVAWIKVEEYPTIEYEGALGLWLC